MNHAPADDTLHIASRVESLRAFSLVEMLTALALITLLVALVIVGMSGVRNAANRTESSNALRQMVSGYLGYSSDHRQRLMPGYVAADYIGEGPEQIDFSSHPRLQTGQSLVDPNDDDTKEDVQSYVWRLSPYMDHAWETMFTDYRSASLLSALHQEFDAEQFGPGTDAELGIAQIPAFGLNSMFLGGDTSHADMAAMSPWWAGSGIDFSTTNPNKIAATRLSEVRNPAMVIVFGPVAEAGTGDAAPYENEMHNQFLGYPELRAPFIEEINGRWMRQQWTLGPGGKVAATSETEFTGPGDATAGLPIVRWGSRQYPVAHLDGSTAVDDITVLSSDMRRWSPFVTGTEPPMVQPASVP